MILGDEKMAHRQTQAEWEREMAEKILRFLEHEIYLELRYLKPALAAFEYREVEGLLTFASDGLCFYFSTEPLFCIFKTNAGFLSRAYLHTMFHCLFRHLFLRGGREIRFWNAACDIAVEYTIDSLHTECTKRILSWIRKDIYEELGKEPYGVSAAVIYRLLKKCDKKKFEALEREFFTDDHRFWPKEKEMDQPFFLQAKEKWDRTARQGNLVQRRRGDDPKEGEARFLAQMKAGKSRRSYREFLRKFAAVFEEPRLNSEEFDLGCYSYGLRLYGNLPLIEPLETRETHKIREFVIVIDTSDSTSGKLVEHFLKETHSILTQKSSFSEKFSIRILQCDDKVRTDDVIYHAGDLEKLMESFQITGGGGTDFRPAFDYIERLIEKGEMKKPAGLLYFTDGLGVYPQKMPAYRTAFLFLEDYVETAVPPWAMRLRLETEDLLHEY